MSHAVTNCPTLPTLEDMARGITIAGEAAAHVQSCDSCRSRIDEIAQNNMLMAELSAIAEPRSARAVAAPSLIVDGYDVMENIGHGGQGVVFRAIQRATKRQVAIKVLIGGRLASSRQRSRFEREVELAAGLRHPNIVTMFDRGTTTDGRPFCVMEYVEGVTLEHMLSGEGSAEWRRIPTEERLRLFSKICSAVEYAHQRGIIHRDLKPANILVDSRREPRIVDFGLARISDTLGIDSKLSVTHEGEFAGTLAYASPEQTQARSELIDTRTDVYSLGVILFEMLTGRLPYDTCGPPGALLHAIEQTPPPRPSSLRAELNDEIDTIVLKALAKDPPRRYQSAGGFLADIERFQAGRPIEAKRDSTWYVMTKIVLRHRVATGLATAVFALVALFAISMVFVTRNMARQRDIAQTERARADENSRLLAQSVHESNVERGRAMSLAGNATAAEELLWKEYLSKTTDPVSAGNRLLTVWALREHYARQPCSVMFKSKHGPFVDFRLRPDGKQLMIKSAGLPKIELLSLPTCRTIGQILQNPSVNSSIQYSPNGQLVACAGSDGTVTVLEIATGACKKSFDVNIRGAKTRFSNDGSLIAVHGMDGKLSILNLASGDIQELEGHSGDVTGVAFNLDGTKVASCAHDGTFRLWDRELGIGRILHTHERMLPPHSTSFSPDGSMIAATGGDFAVGFWNPTDGRFMFGFERIFAPPMHLQFRPDGKVLATSVGANVILWDLQERRAIRTLAGNTSAITSVQYSDDCEMLLSTDYGSFRVWDLKDAADRVTLTGHAATVHAAVISTDGTILVSGSADQSVRMWDVTSGESIATLPCASIVESIALNQNGLLAVATHKKTVQFWNATSQLRQGEIQDLDARVNSLCFSIDGSRLFTATIDGAIEEWDSASHLRQRMIGGKRERISRMAVSPDGRMLAAGGKSSNSVRLWELAPGRELAPLIGHEGAVRCVCFSPSGKWLASTSDDHSVRLWDMHTMKLVATLVGSHSRVSGAAFSKDESMLASCDLNGEIRVWDVDSRRCLATYEGKSGALFGICFGPNSRRVAYWGTAGTVTIKDLHYYDSHIEGNRPYWLDLFAAADN